MKEGTSVMNGNISKLNHDSLSNGKCSDNMSNRPNFKKDHIDAHYDKFPWVLGAFGRLFDLKFAPINIPLERRLQTFAAFFWMSTFLFMGLGSLAIMLYMFFYTKFWWVSLCYFSYYIGDRRASVTGGRRIPWVREWTLWKHFANFFPARIIKTQDYDPKKNYLFGYHPHGVLTAGAAAHFATEGSNFSKVFPGLTPTLLVLGGHFSLPFYRDFFMSFGACSAAKESIEYLLGGTKKGKALCLVVGGALESLDCHPGKAVLYLNKRKGFCKIALRTGTNLVPIYSFGENEVYDQVKNPKGSTFRNIQDSLQKVLGFAPLAFMGRGIFQYSFGIVPFRKPINTVFGKPIEVQKVEEPTSEQICELHAKYVQALTDLYYEYRSQYAEYPNVDLQII